VPGHTIRQDRRIDRNFVNDGTACSDVTVGSITLLLIWTDNSGTQSAFSLPMQQLAKPNRHNGFIHLWNHQNECMGIWASGTFTIQSTGAIIQYATGYTACTAGTGTYELNATVTRLQ
jgi:hypothetical protein